MDTVIELLLPYLDLPDLGNVGNTNKYWNDRIHGMLPDEYYLTINYSNGSLMSGSVHNLMIPLPSICSNKWKKLFQLNNNKVPPLSDLKFFVLSICPKGLNTSPLFQMYKHNNNMYWSSSKNSRYHFQPKDYTNLEKIEIEFSLK
jgi:hypothetical protein